MSSPEDRLEDGPATSGKQQAVLQITGLRKTFQVPRSAGGGAVHAVSGVDLTIGRGEIVGLVGESGSGKSTVGRCVLRLLDPDDGQILLDGTDITRLSRRHLRPLRPKMHMVFQDPFSSLNPRMRIADIVAAPLRAAGNMSRRQVAEAVDEVLTQVGLSPALRGRYPHELSGGQRQRVGLARSLVVRPLLLVADEPTSALDVSVQAAILNQVADLHRELGFACLFISHDLAVIEYMCDRIAIMYLGTIVETGTRSQIFSAPRHPYTRALLSAALTPGSGLGGSSVASGAVPAGPAALGSVAPAPAAPGSAAAGTGLDAQRQDGRIVLAGELPDPRHPPSGCPFHTRCPIAQFPLCSEKEPDAVTIASGHWARCHFAGTAED